MSNERPVRLPDDSGGIRFILMPKENQNRASTALLPRARHRTIGSPSKRSSKSAMASSAKTLSDLLRPAKRLRPVSPSPQTLSPKSSVSTLCMSPLTGDDPGPSLISGHRKRRDADRSLSRSKCNLRICSERIENSRAQGVDYVKLQELLVDETWLEALTGELQKPYAKNLCRFVEWEMRGGVPIYPPPHLIFNALHSTPFDQVKAVIIGQDPYHGPGQAMGLAFSVPEGIKVPSSLMNIYKELKHDIGCSLPSHGNLERWAVQGVLLLNAVLTVRKNQANSHAKKGWEPFTDAVIQMISQKKTGVVFLLWGKFAQQKSRLIDESKHHILTAAHPSGLSANRGFFGCRHFSQTNQILERLGLSPIDWQL